MANFESMNVALTPWPILAATAALLAFLIGLYTLVGRERKSPYLINAVFPVFLVSVLSAFFSVASVLFPNWQSNLLTTAVIFLLIAILLTAWRVCKLYVRFAWFVDRMSVKDVRAYRCAKDIIQWLRGDVPYEHNPEPIGSEFLDKVKDVLCEEATREVNHWNPSNGPSLSIAFQRQGQATDLLARLALVFLKEGHAVQYMATSRHPIELVVHLKSLVESQVRDLSWNQAAQRMVVVDAFTPHFGFTDSIHRVKKREFNTLGVTYVPSSVSYAGMHTATSKAFNRLKKRANSSVRRPTLVIYEDTHALADLESHEQYRIFVRHVIPSERMWGSMFTVFTEVMPPDEDWNILSSYTNVSLDMRASSRSVAIDRGVEA